MPDTPTPDVTVNGEPPPTDAQLRAIDLARISRLLMDRDRVRELIAVSSIYVTADAVRVTLTPAVARELFALLDVGISLGEAKP